MNDLSHLCGASMPGGLIGTTMLGPCVLRIEHDGPVHQAADGLKWAGIQPHPFQQIEDVFVTVCVCGLCPATHSHVGESPETCGCAVCRPPVEPEEPDDETIRAYLDRHPEVLRAFLAKEARRSAPWLREFVNREERIRGHRNPRGIL